MLVPQEKIDALLSGPLNDSERHSLGYVREFNAWDSERNNPSPEFGRQLWYAGVNAHYKGPKPPTLPEVLDGDSNADSYRGGVLEGMIGEPNAQRLRLLVIAEYLFGEPDPRETHWLDVTAPRGKREKVTRLEGELRRYGARVSETTPQDMTLSPALINKYCTQYNLQPLEPLMKEALHMTS